MKPRKAEYDLIAEQWRDSRKQLPPEDASLFSCFIDGLPGGANVLDLGCGNGVPVVGLLESRGFRVAGVDRSDKLLAQARETFPHLRLARAEIEEYVIEDDYVGIVLWDVLFHLPRESHRPLLTSIFNALPGNGLLILSSGGSKESLAPFTDTMFGVEFYYDAYPVDEFIDLCGSIGFEVVKFEVLNEPDGGRDKGRIGVVLARD
jgi:SAM-dependent methyltransferase